MAQDDLIFWCPGDSCCDEAWEQAYLDFETPQRERAKFLARYRKLGVDRWPKDLALSELFCGRGNGLRALEQLGFTDLEGVDLSPRLLRQYEGSAQRSVGDCRHLQWPDVCKDGIVVQGGLHHLPTLPEDLIAVLDEIVRVLKPEGRFVLVEPWPTPFLALAHAVTNQRLIRRIYKKGDALARMTEREAETYYNWLGRSREILDLIHQRFVVEKQIVGWGKLMFVGRPK